MDNYNHAIFKGIFEAAIDAIIAIDKKGIILAFNPAAIKLFGYTPEEIVGLNIKTLMPKCYAKHLDECLHHDLDTGKETIAGIGRNVAGKHKDGTEFPLHLSVSEAIIDGKKLFVGFARDIQAFKAMETHLHISENRAKAILDSAIDGIAVIDKNGILQSVNHAMTTLFQYDESELVGQPIEKLMSEPYAKEHNSHIKHYLETGEKHVIGVGRTINAKRKDGVIFPIFISVNEFIIDNTLFFASIIRDITQQTANETFLTDQTNKLKLLNQELESFSYSVSHDLNTPLRHVIGYIGLLNKHIENSQDEQVKKYIKIITDEAFRMEGLIQSLLGFSRLGRASLKKSKFAFNDLINEVITHFKPETKGRVIDWQVSPLPEVYCDKKMLRMVWENLISNALKFTKNKEKTIIKIGYKELPSEYQFSIQDNGIGFNPTYTDKLFKVFQRLHADSDFSGTGIGLVNIKKIIEKHNGRIWIEGQPEQGATVYFTLPL